MKDRMCGYIARYIIYKKKKWWLGGDSYHKSRVRDRDGNSRRAQAHGGLDFEILIDISWYLSIYISVYLYFC